MMKMPSPHCSLAIDRNSPMARTERFLFGREIHSSRTLDVSCYDQV